MKIKVINPNTSVEMTASIGAAARSVARPGTEIIAVSPTFGPASIESYYDEFMCVPGTIDEVLSEADAAWFELARQVREKKFGPARPADFREKARQMKFLQYRGFEQAHIQSAMN